jgi:hypothetical protein
MVAHKVEVECKPDPLLNKCSHFAQQGGYTVIKTSGQGVSYKQQASHLCAACLPDGTKVYE